ncbi:MAG: hypothetical protein P9L93_06235 [Candidatus Gorgyraea atricola]|nr:hypothetical protein [Candidatus Gorgyraea atricola]
MGLDDDVLIVGQGGTIYLPMACAVRAKRVDIVQPDRSENVKQRKHLKDKFDHMRIFEAGTLQAYLVNKIDIDSYRGLIENVRVPKGHYRYVFIPAVLDYLNRFARSKKEKLVKAILSTLKDDAVVLISTLSGNTKITVKQEADFFQEYAKSHGYEITGRRALRPVHTLGGSPTIELKISRETRHDAVKKIAEEVLGDIERMWHRMVKDQELIFEIVSDRDLFESIPTDLRKDIPYAALHQVGLNITLIYGDLQYLMEKGQPYVIEKMYKSLLLIEPDLKTMIKLNRDEMIEVLNRGLRLKLGTLSNKKDDIGPIDELARQTIQAVLDGIEVEEDKLLGIRDVLPETIKIITELRRMITEEKLIIKIEEDEFVILKELYTNVYKADDSKRQKKVVLKFQGDRNSSVYEKAFFELVPPHDNIVKGYALEDESGKILIVQDFIEGKTLEDYSDLEGVDHKRYYKELFPILLEKFVEAVNAEKHVLKNDQRMFYHEFDLDHIIIDETRAGKPILIDFNEPAPRQIEKKVISNIGNSLCKLVMAQLYSDDEDDLSEYGIDDDDLNKDDYAVNAKKICPYVSDELNQILMRFAASSTNPYEDIDELINDLEVVLDYLKSQFSPSESIESLLNNGNLETLRKQL